ncbi:hypothetical protein GCM10010261_20910 [Streptomyces pilosus]|uniref:hypothetical protein n=1 Tax=Streptomyces pilosus TaxID=28893 RepID=UPI001671E374|nr:hypothetical protein [Streptomyces pilosus]GGV46120.1 hypothetical protein GCM10010261_20910 [Streptomyces pilosus]
MTQRHPITPVRHPRVIQDFYRPEEVEALFGVVRRHAPWQTILSHHFTSTDEYLAVSGATGTDSGSVKLSDFIAPTFRGYLAEEGVVLYPELHDIYLSKRLLDPIRAMHGATYGLASHMLFNIGVPSHSFDAGHFDSGTWLGCSIVNTPVWLLSVMAKSGLFDKWVIKTGQMITYFYDSDIDGGFTYWPDGPDRSPQRFAAPFHNTCVLSDNSLMYHRRESSGPAHLRDHPRIRLESRLHHEEGDWVIRNGEEEIGRFGDKDMRSLFHYTALVFDDLPDVRRYLDHTDDLSHDKVFGILMQDLKHKGASFREPEDPMTDTDFIAVLDKTYAMAPDTYPTEAPLVRRSAA